MQYRKLGRTGVDVSSLCLGTMMFGGATNEKDSIRIIHRALDAGINFVDTANIYNQGESEVVVGRGLVGRREARWCWQQKPGCPLAKGRTCGEQVAITCCPSWTPACGASTPTMSICFTFMFLMSTRRWMNHCVRWITRSNRGKVLYGACSNFRSWQLCNSLWTSDRLGLAPLSCVQPLYNIVNRDIEVELLPLCRQQRTGCCHL